MPDDIDLREGWSSTGTRRSREARGHTADISQTRGEDAAEIKDDIENALADLRRSKSTPAAAKADKRYPRPPPEWSEQKALTFWRMLPKTVQGIRFAARMRREVRPLLLHTLPHVRARDPEACDTLQRSVRGVCGHYNAQGETIHTCMCVQSAREARADARIAAGPATIIGRWIIARGVSRRASTRATRSSSGRRPTIDATATAVPWPAGNLSERSARNTSRKETLEMLATDRVTWETC